MDTSGEIVLSRVVIPEYVVVHDGSPNDSTAKDYYVRYRDYIKNVASSEIYATWPDNTIRAKCIGNYVLYFKSCIPNGTETRDTTYYHFIYCFRPQMDARAKYL